MKTVALFYARKENMINLRFCKMLKEQGFFINIYTMNGGSKMRVIFDEDSKPISPAQLQQRFEQYKLVHGCSANTEKFSLVVSLPVYQVRLDV